MPVCRHLNYERENIKYNVYEILTCTRAYCSLTEIIQNLFVLKVLLHCMAELPHSMEMLHFLVGATVTVN
jgi:hypothetical protein